MLYKEDFDVYKFSILFKELDVDKSGYLTEKEISRELQLDRGDQLTKK